MTRETINPARRQICLEAAWEIDALARVLPGLVPESEEHGLGPRLVFRGIAERLLSLAAVLAHGLEDERMSTDQLERELLPYSGVHSKVVS